jgi:hypothetical protein
LSMMTRNFEADVCPINTIEGGKLEIPVNPPCLRQWDKMRTETQVFFAALSPGDEGSCRWQPLIHSDPFGPEH